MIENTLMSLVSLMGLVWIATQGLKRALPSVSQDLIAVILGQAATMIFWQMGMVKLDGADVANATPWTYALVVVYGLLAYGLAAKGHDVGQTPEKLLKRVKGGKVVD